MRRNGEISSLLTEVERKRRYSSPEEAEAFILEALEEGNRRILSKLELVNEGIKSEARWAQAWAPVEEELYSKFAGIVNEENEFFSLSHIDKLQLEYEILIFLGKKNIGKTTEIYRLMEETISRGRKFIYIRYTRNELEKSQEAFNNDSNSPVRMVEEKSVWKFYPTAAIRKILRERKLDENTHINNLWLKQNKVEFVGYAYEFSYCQSYTGGQYEKFELIFYDECLTYDPRNTLNEKHLNNWAAFLSSIARNKPNLKVFLFGNLQGTNNLILDFYGIDRDDKFRYIVRGGEEGGCRVLFINSGELYRGYESQNRAARHAGGQFALKLMGNEYLVTTTELIEPKVFNLFEHYAYFEYGGVLFQLKKRMLKGKLTLAVKAVDYSGVEYFEEDKIYSSSKLQCIRYTNLVYSPIADLLLEKLSIHAYFRELRYYNEFTMEKCHLLIEENPLQLELFIGERRREIRTREG